MWWARRRARKGERLRGIEGFRADPEKGPGPTVREHGEMLVKHDTEIKNIVKGMDEGRGENREAHKQIFDAINSLRAGK